MPRNAVIILFLLSCAGIALAQRYRGGEGWLPEDAPVRTAREAPTHSVDMPVWTNAPIRSASTSLSMR